MGGGIASYTDEELAELREALKEIEAARATCDDVEAALDYALDIALEILGVSRHSDD